MACIKLQEAPSHSYCVPQCLGTLYLFAKFELKLLLSLFSTPLPEFHPTLTTK